VAQAARASARRAKGRARAERRRRQAAWWAGARPRVYGDAAYGSGEFLEYLARHGIDSRCKTQPPVAPGGRFSKDRFTIDLDTDAVTCPSGQTAPIRRNQKGDGIASFGDACATCPLRVECTAAESGRTIAVGRHESLLAEARAQARDPDWRDDYRGTRPRWNENSATSCDAATGKEERGSAAIRRSTPTSTYSRPPRISPGSQRSACAAARTASG
jgi:hypothetical protein